MIVDAHQRRSAELAASYDQVRDAMVAILGGTPTDVFANTAVSTYKLDGVEQRNELEIR